MDNLQFKSNLNTFIGDLLFLYSNYTGIQIVNHKLIINEIFQIFEKLNPNSIHKTTIKYLQTIDVSIKSINRYEFLSDFYLNNYLNNINKW